MKFYLDRKILAGFLSSIVVVLSLGFIAFLFFSALLDAARWTNHSRNVLNHAEEVQSACMEIETSQRGYAISGNDEFLESYQPAIKSSSEHIRAMDSLTRDNASQQQRISQLKKSVDNRVKFAEKVIRARKNSFEEARNIILTLGGKIETEKIKSILDDIKAEENRLIIERTKLARDQFSLFIIASLVLMVVIISILVSVTFMINRNLRLRTIAETNLREAEQETAKINRELEAFTYSVSHDLRAPLRSINGYAQVLKEDYGTKIDEEGNQVIKIIISNARRMGQLIDDLLDFSRLGRQEIKKSKINTQEFVKAILTELIEEQKGRNIKLDFRPLMPTLADVNMIRQVWINLLSNALKYTQKKENTLIEIGCKEESDEIVYYVKDNGAGFDMQYQHKLFGVFQRLHKATDFEGTGVGLALVKRIVERHKGRVWAEAKANEGATFYFSIPKNI